MRRGLPEGAGATAAGPAAVRRPGRVQRGGAVPAGPGRAGRQQRLPRPAQGAGGAGAALRQPAPLPVAEGDQVAQGREALRRGGGGEVGRARGLAAAGFRSLFPGPVAKEARQRRPRPGALGAALRSPF